MTGTANVKLYARWTTRPTYAITYLGNGNTAGNAPGAVSNEVDSAVTVADQGTLVKKGHSFNEWNTSADGSGKGFKKNSLFTMAAENDTLYAQWRINRYKVTFNIQGGSPVDSQMVNYNDTAKTPTAPTRTGYAFGGWFKEAACTNKWTFAADKVTGNVTLYAKWTINQYKVTFNSQGGSVVDSQMVNYTDTAKTPTAPTRTGYAFVGWFKEAACTNKWTFTADKVTGNVTLYAKWLINVTFNAQGGSAVSLQTVNSGATLTAPTAPAKKSYTFAGWFKDAGCTDDWVFADDKVTLPITLYAKWVIKDADGNIYTEVKIGNQVWMVENLKMTKYRDGSPIYKETDNAAWSGLATAAYCWYGNDSATYKNPYGALYNWHVVDPSNTKKVAPEGWHVPTAAEWDTLLNYLIANKYSYDSTTTGNKVAKSMAATTKWNINTDVGTIGNDLTKNNRSGFSAFPGGYRYYDDGSFYSIGDYGSWWSATESDATSAWGRDLYYSIATLNRNSNSKRLGFSIRCVRDQ